MARYDAYVICTAPRSGSTLLCRLLAGAGQAGNPASYFHTASISDWEDQLGLSRSANTSERDRLRRVFDAAQVEGRAGGEVFGLRLQADSLGFFRAALARLHPDPATDSARVRAVFGRTLFVHLTRPDKLAQAISCVIAEQTGLWHLAPDGSEIERCAPHRDPVYDAGQIAAMITRMEERDRIWATWFAREGVVPLRLDYDTLSADPHAVLRQLLGGLGLDPSSTGPVGLPLKKLAGPINRDWATRFRAETGRP